MAKTAFILLIGVACALAAPSDNSGGRIIGGSKAADGQFPYQASVQYEGVHSCGGSIIDASTILTAAHCAHELIARKMTVMTGSNQIGGDGVVHQIKSYVVHQQYDNNLINDIALLKLVSPMELNDLSAPIDLADAETGDDEDCIFSGWGTVTNPGVTPNDLQYINLKTHNVKSCRTALAGTLPIYGDQICTLTKKGEGVCFGDSGGPLVSAATGKQIGISSWGIACATGVPDVYTKISSYLDWIKENK